MISNYVFSALNAHFIYCIICCCVAAVAEVVRNG